MKNLRIAIAWITVLLLAIGYVASQRAYFQGAEAARKYSQEVDSPSIILLAMVLFLAIVGFAFFPGKESDRG